MGFSYDRKKRKYKTNRRKPAKTEQGKGECCRRRSGALLSAGKSAIPKEGTSNWGCVIATSFSDEEAKASQDQILQEKNLRRRKKGGRRTSITEMHKSTGRNKTFNYPPRGRGMGQRRGGGAGWGAISGFATSR